ncbi:molybdenum cofactor guanylyltransferase [Nodosilinea sp. LEGE 07088]|uniref:molybdenum cofactor guanylyltransferase n=1 Tax=Nodosilinea sp. LEGE 07088 TaxID=2777968 RepID=UPI001881460D|nr:molybdenum cofactor guanylyltransferase [Nodosilinea sp. LEGE 07088]MBE9140553.1 molybdenum cofactor guanylyltransferase [Nodosilinea sp. LEGE 07088]
MRVQPQAQLPTSPLIALILAGGRSSRMGYDKALIDLGAETLIQRTCRVALACASSTYVVTPWPNRYRPLLPDAVGFIEEDQPPTPTSRSPGPLRGLLTALSHLQGAGQSPAWVLVLACDMPNLSAAILCRWRRTLAQLAPEVLAYVPQRAGRWEPLCGFYRGMALTALEQYAVARADPNAKAPSLQRWLDQHLVTPITLAPEEWAMVANLNTPRDWARWHQATEPNRSP